MHTPSLDSVLSFIGGLAFGIIAVYLLRRRRQS